MEFDGVLLGLVGRVIVINILPFFLLFHLVMRRREQFYGKGHSELALVAREIKIVGVMGYVIILSMFFFSIPVLRYLKTKPGYDIILIEPDGFTVYLIALLSFALVVSGIYLKVRRAWAFYLLVFLLWSLLGYAFFSILEWGLISAVPVAVFSYLLYQLSRPSLRRELKADGWLSAKGKQ